MKPILFFCLIACAKTDLANFIVELSSPALIVSIYIETKSKMSDFLRVNERRSLIAYPELSELPIETEINSLRNKLK